MDFKLLRITFQRLDCTPQEIKQSQQISEGKYNEYKGIFLMWIYFQKETILMYVLQVR